MMRLPSIFQLAAFLSVIISCAHAFSLDTSRSAKHVRAIYQDCRTRHHNIVSQQFNSRIVLKAAESEEEEDDGWGDSVSTTTASSSDRISKSQELASLQNDMAMKQQNKSTQSSSPTDTSDSKERDLFIPIFTLVSVIGFSGLYGYEMLRLYSKGELYLPWNN
mmetsp:Transcript_21053/g.31787  ORF Transcript_21053/g.31787 Transcript_21053/m.31787 type:complete len:163 (+) Transcript_21053:108-596(+)